MKISWASWIVPVLFVGIFIVSSAAGVSNLVKEHAFLSAAELDDGTITDYQVDSSGKSVVFCPIIDFKTKAGEPQSYEGADCKNHPQDVPIGQHVQVYFDPKQPDRFQTYHGSALYGYLDGSFAIFFGLLFLAIAGLMIAVNVVRALRGRGQPATPATPLSVAQPHRPRHTSVQPSSSAERDSEASLEAQAARLKAETERLQAAQAELERKIEARRKQGQ